MVGFPSAFHMSTSTLMRLLRLGGVFCFVGHGAFGVITKESWLPYFATFGIDRTLAYQLMPLVGWLDIAMGLSLLVTLRPALLAWMFIWTVFTAALRPMAGEPMWEMFERAGNYGVPLALLLMVWPSGGWRNNGWRAWFAEARVHDDPTVVQRRALSALVMSCALLLVGHGMLGLNGKPGLVTNLATVFPLQAAALTPMLGGFELVLAAAVVAAAIVAVAGLAVAGLAGSAIAAATMVLGAGVALWKLATESLFLLAGASFWEVVERGGSYVVPLAIAVAAYALPISSVSRPRRPS